MIEIIEERVDVVTPDTFCDIVYRLRTEKYMTAFDLAVDADINPCTVTQIENGSNTSLKTMHKILEVFDKELYIGDKR